VNGPEVSMKKKRVGSRTEGTRKKKEVWEEEKSASTSVPQLKKIALENPTLLVKGGIKISGLAKRDKGRGGEVGKARFL